MTKALPDTRHSLFLRLRDADQDAWREFVVLYEPAVYGFARRRGLQDADARELTQEVLSRVLAAMPGWRPDRPAGTFRGWLFTVARSRLIDAWRASQHAARPTGNSSGVHSLAAVAAPDHAGGDFEADLRRSALRLAAERIRSDFTSETWSAFWRTAVEGDTPAAAAAALGLSVGAVYAARSRVLARLRASVKQSWPELVSPEDRS